MKNEDITLDMLDADSREFIEWSMELLVDPEYFREFVLESIRKIKNYYSRDPEEIKQALRKKFIIGGYEHGSPAKYTNEDIEKELELEYQDIVGWKLVGLYAEWKRATRTTK